MRQTGFGTLVTFVTAGLVLAAPSGACATDGNSGGAKSLAVGAQAVIKPKYEGSDEHDTYVLPMVIPKFSGSDDENPSTFKKIRRRVNFRGLDDIRFRVLGRGTFEAGAVGGYIGGRDQDDAVRLLGLGDIDGGLVLGGYAGFRYGDVMFDAAVIDQVSGDSAGAQVRLGAEIKRQITPAVKVTARAGTTFASDKYMQTYFGVTPTQAANSVVGLPAFNASSGIKDVHLILGAETWLKDRWVLRAGGRYGRLLGDAADSPVIETEDQFSGTLGLAYKFNFSR